MKICTWNVNGIRAREAQVLEWVKQEQPDLLCLQETKASLEDIPESLRSLDGYWCYWHGHKGYSGVALHVRQAFSPRPVFSHPRFDHENRIVEARLGDLRVASIYVPNGGKDFPAKIQFLEAMEEYAAEAQSTGVRLILCGDLNVARTERDVHPKLRKPEQIGQTHGERVLLEKIIARGLTDVGRALDPDNDQLFTWWAPWRNMRERNIGWRLDYVLVSQALAEKAIRCYPAREFGLSDHSPVVATFDVPAPCFEPASSDEGHAPISSGQLSLGL